jgi:iron complex transport system substrate-binding protein
VSLVPAVTEMLFAMGAGGDVVGVSSYDAFPPEAAALPKVGALVDPDFERILSLRPDLVILYGSQDELVARLDRVNIPAFRYRHAGLADVLTTVRDVGTRVGRADAAHALARRIESDIEAIRRATAGERPPLTLLIFGRENGTLRGIYASAGVGFLHDMLIAAGGRDVLGDVARESLQMSVEVLLARAPEVIVEVHPSGGWTPERLARERAVWAGLPALPAVRTGRIHILSDDRLLIPGPRVAAAVRLLAETLHPAIAGR